MPTPRQRLWFVSVGSLAIASLLSTVIAGAAVQTRGTPRFRALVFSKVTNYYHQSIPAGVEAIRNLGAKKNFEVVASDDAAQFTDAQLAGYQVVVFNNTNSTPEKGALLDAPQRAAFQRYIRKGGGFVGIHSASGTERDWEWYGQLVGAFFKVHPKIQRLEINIEDRQHPSTSALPESWVRTEEPYDFVVNPRGKVHVLMTFNPASYEGHTMGPDHPIAWCHNFEGGRSWYTALGHAPSAFSEEPLFIQHLLGGIEWAAGVATGNCSVR